MPNERGVGLKGWISGQKSKDTRVQTKKGAVSLKHRVAVLPLTNMISDPGEEYFSDGMTEELISALANVSGLVVISRTSVMQYKNTTKTAYEIGQDLAAGTIIEGSVRKAGRRVRISVQLIDTREDKHLWAESYDRELEDVFEVQRDIARNVAESLKVRLLPRESAQMEKRATQNMEAYTLYLKGRHQWNKRTRESVGKSIEYLESAISLDPSYALGYAGLADCYNIAADWGYMSPKDAYAKAKKAAFRALELNSGLAEAHAALGVIYEAEWNWAAAESEFKRAIELNPNYASARHWYSALLAALGRAQEAVVECRLGSEVDPLSPIIAVHLGLRLSEMGEYELAAEQYEKALEVQPDFYPAIVELAYSYAKRSMCQEALAECQKINSLPQSNPYARATVARVYALCGSRGELKSLLEESANNLDAESPFLFIIAEAYSVAGEVAKAIELLRMGYEAHNPFLSKIGRTEDDNLRSNPRVIELLRKMGLRK